MSTEVLPAPGLDGAVVEQPKGTVGVTRKRNLGNYESEEVSVFIQFPVTFENEAETIAAANDAAFQAKSVVYAQLGLDAEYESGVLQVKAAFPGVVAEPPSSAEGNGSGTASTSAPSVEASTGSGQAAASASDGPVCPECQGELWDNRGKNKKRKEAGQKALPEGRCKNYKEPPEGTKCPGIVWDWSKGK